MTLRAIVVDDEPLARDELAFLLGEAGGVEVVAEAQNAAEALERCAALVPDVAFVDLKMPGPDGIALAQALVARHDALDVVVVSAHDEGALRAYEARVIDYLLKPVRLARLQDTLHRLQSRTRANKAQDPTGTAAPLTRLAVKRKGVLVVLEIEDIVYFEVKDELVWAVTAHDRYALDLTLANIEQRMPAGQFFRSHRGVLVRLNAIQALEPNGAGTFELLLRHPDNPRVPLARERARTLRTVIPIAG